MTTTTTDPSPPDDEPIISPADPASSKDKRRPAATLKMLARRVHFLAGLSIAPFLAVLCLSGLAYAFTPQINTLLYSDKLFVTAHNGPAHPLAEQIQAALAGHPQGELSSVIPAEEPDRTTQVVLSEPGLGGSGSQPKRAPSTSTRTPITSWVT
jgi:hypothetical protein